jgi:hypothetical protein
MPDDVLLREAERLARVERQSTAALVRVLMEVDGRRLYLREGCASLFVWCTQALGLEEGAAYNRIEVARAARRFPAALEALERGRVSLTAVRLLAPHLTPANHEEVLARAGGLPKREVLLLVAELAPRPTVADSIRRLTSATLAPRAVPCGVPLPRATSSASPSAATTPVDPAGPPVAGDAPPAAPAAEGASTVPLTPTRFRLHVTLSTQTHAKLLLAQDLLRHAVPDGNLAEVIDRALTVLVQQLERQRFAATATPRAPSTRSSSTARHIPAAVKRAVWQRDGGRCAFVGRQGRCRERTFLEYHHAMPYAAGGEATVENISLHCRAHNAFEAAQFFGPVAMSRTGGRPGAAAAAGPSG